MTDTESTSTPTTGTTDASQEQRLETLTRLQSRVLPLDLAAVGEALQHDLSLHRKPGITDANAELVQALCVVEEAGEFGKAYRRAAGLARSPGSWAEVEDEIADILITTAVFADMRDIDIYQCVRRKLLTIYSRGWGDEDAEGPEANDCAT